MYFSYHFRHALQMDVQQNCQPLHHVPWKDQNSLCHDNLAQTGAEGWSGPDGLQVACFSEEPESNRDWLHQLKQWMKFQIKIHTYT